MGRLKHRFRIREMEDQELQDCENVFAFQDQKTGFDPFLSYVGDLKENQDKNHKHKIPIFPCLSNSCTILVFFDTVY